MDGVKVEAEQTYLTRVDRSSSALQATRDELPSPFSAVGTTSSTGGEDLVSESGSSTGVRSSSSTQTGNRSLVRRANEFDRLLQSQRNVLTDFDTPSRQETEDDDLQSELRDLARSELLLRKELEVFSTSFHRNSQNDEEEDEDMDDLSTLPDYGDPALMGVNEGQLSPRNGLTPGMAPLSPPRRNRWFDDEDLESPTPDEARADHLTRTNQHSSQPAQISANIVPFDSDEFLGAYDGLGGTALPHNIGGPPISPLDHPVETFRTFSPARISLDNEKSNYAVQANNLQANKCLPSFPGPDEALNVSQSSEDSLFADLARLSSTTPRVSNIKGNPNEPLYQPTSPYSDANSELNPPSLPSLVHGPTVSPIANNVYHSQPVSNCPSPRMSQYGRGPVIPSAVQASCTTSPAESLYSVPLSTHSFGQNPASALVFSHSPLSTNRVGQFDLDDHVALLRDFESTAWEVSSGENLLPASRRSTPLLPDDDNEVATYPSVEYKPRVKRKRAGIFLAGVMPAKEGWRTGGLSPTDTWTIDGDNLPQKKKWKSMAWRTFLLICTICVIAIPSTLMRTSDRRGSTSAVGLGVGSDGVGGGLSSSAKPSWSPSQSQTLLPTNYVQTPRLPVEPSSLPTAAPLNSGSGGLTQTPTGRPTSKPSMSWYPPFLDQPSSSPTLTPRPSTPRPTRAPSSLQSSPSYSPNAIPTGQPTGSPTVSKIPTVHPSADGTLFPVMIPTVVPSGSPSWNPSRRPFLSPSTARPSPVPISTDQASVPPTGNPVVTTGSPTNIPPVTVSLLNLLQSVSFDGGAALDSVDSPQYAAYQWLANDSGLSGYSDNRKVQRYAMATLYFALDGDSWSRNDSWLSREDECDWYSRIEQNRCGGSPSQRTLRRLVMYYNNLHGFLPPEMGLLTDLEEIHLVGGPDRFILGAIPSELGYLTALTEVQLADNDISGTIPATLTSLSQLGLLDLSRNSIRGPLSDELVAGWTRLYELNLSSNSLTGRLPYMFSPSLEFLDLAHNSMSGAIPESIGILERLRIMNLDDNLFISLPSTIISLQSLEELSVQSNRLEGPVVPEIGGLSRLRSLRLRDNRLTGTIPTHLGRLNRLSSILDLSYNDLTGSIPEQLGEVSDRLRSLRLAGNRLSGRVPVSLSNLKRLAEVRLEGNNLTGAVPEEVCNIWDSTLPMVYIDCEEVDCPCCNFCCRDSGDCACRYEKDTALKWRCF